MWWLLLGLVLWLSGRFDDEIGWVVSTIAIGFGKLVGYCAIGVALLYLLT